MRYHLFQKFFGKMIEIKEMSFLSTRGMTLMFGNCITSMVITYPKNTATPLVFWLKRMPNLLPWESLYKNKETGNSIT